MTMMDQMWSGDSGINRMGDMVLQDNAPFVACVMISDHCFLFIIAFNDTFGHD